MKILPALHTLCLFVFAGTHAAAQYSYPITRDTLNRFNKHLELECEIAAYSTLYPQCGFYCSCGTLKLKLLNSQPGYKYPFVYVAFTCFDDISEKDLTSGLSLHLTKIAMLDHSCFWEAPFNTFDTEGLPFYKLDKPFREKSD